MALTYSKHIFFKILIKNGKKYLLPTMGSRNTFFNPVAQYSDDKSTNNKRISKAMKAYLERAEKYDKFLEEQLKEFDLGKQHLANMMGKKGKEMTQEEIDDAIAYLFPSGLYVPGARPLMKPPNEIFAERKSAEFDFTGRPYHSLFYTTKPNFTQLLHDAAQHLEKINAYELKMKRAGVETPDRALILAGGEWLSKEELEAEVLEKIFTIDYDRFIEVFERLASHPYAYLIESFIKTYRKEISDKKSDEIPEPLVAEDGSLYVHIPVAGRKSARAEVTVIYPGDGKVLINGQGIDYFMNIQAREQVLFPLIFTDMLGKVNITGTVAKTGETSEAGALRYGICLALQSFVSSEMRLKMKLAGLLQLDYRTRERKKPGKSGARRGYTWLKR